MWAAEAAQQLRALAVLPEDPGSIPSIHMAAHSCLLTPVPEDKTSSHRYIHAGKTPVDVSELFKKKKQNT